MNDCVVSDAFVIPRRSGSELAGRIFFFFDRSFKRFNQQLVGLANFFPRLDLPRFIGGGRAFTAHGQLSG